MTTAIRINGTDISSSDKNAITLSLTPAGSPTSKSFSVKLLALRYHKKMYQPGMVIAKLELESGDIPTIISSFKGQTVNVLRGTTIVATNYYIYKVLPEYQSSKLMVTLYCYSRDHKLTLNPYCRTYVNKKLVGTNTADGIIQKELFDGILKAAGYTTETVECDNLRLLKYIRAVSQEKTDKEIDTKVEKREFIQPYLVQYNESFYDFLARITNRCGEFLYHEGDTLHIGAPANNQITLTAANMLGYRYVGLNASPITPEVTYTDGMDLTNNNAIYAQGSSYFTYDEIPVDEYLGMYLYENRNNAKVFFQQRWREVVVDFFNAVLNHPSLDGILTGWYLKYMDVIDDVKLNTAKQNKDEKTTYLDAALEDQKDYEYKDPGENQQLEEKGLGITLYGSMLSRDTKRQNYEELHNLDAKFYRFVNKCTHDVSQQLVEVDVDLNSATCALGDVVTFNGGTYIVVEVKETLKEDGATGTDTVQGQTIVLAPKYTAQVMAYNPSKTVDDDFYVYINQAKQIVIVKRDKNGNEFSYTISTNGANFETSSANAFSLAKQNERAAVRNQSERVAYDANNKKRVAIRIKKYSYSKYVNGWLQTGSTVGETDFNTAKDKSWRSKYAYTYKDEDGGITLVTQCTKVIDNGPIQGATYEDYSKAYWDAYEYVYYSDGTKITIKKEGNKYYKPETKDGKVTWTELNDKDVTDTKLKATEFTYRDNSSTVVLTVHSDKYYKTIDNGIIKEATLTEFNKAAEKEKSELNKDEYTYKDNNNTICVKRTASYDYYKVVEGVNDGKYETSDEVFFIIAEAGSWDHGKKNDDIYDVKTDLTFFCPPAVVPFVRTCGTQRAFVARVEDPEGYGRVCIRYPWQKKEDEPSPWIRMAVPFAPNDGCEGKSGFFFEPDTGDEVLVDYENGNIEHPFIVGTLYTHRTQAPEGTRSIVSRKGHSITFNDGDSVSDFAGGVYPGWKILKPLIGTIPGATVDVFENECVTGGITLTDRWGFYKISASTTQRKVTINSAFGDVLIDAFTGITINAPNGDVKIKGKNVTIEAGNNLTLRSGTNIDEKKISDNKALNGLATFGGLVGKSLLSAFVAPFADVSLARTVYEAFLKPIAGTLTIDSGRYLLLNAGGAKAEIPNRGLSVHGMQKEEKDYIKQYKLANTIALIPRIVDVWNGHLMSGYDRVRRSEKGVIDQEYYKKLVPEIKNPIGKVWADISSNAPHYTPEQFNFSADLTGRALQNAKLRMFTGMADLRWQVSRIIELCNEIKSAIHFGDPIFDHIDIGSNNFYGAELKAAIVSSDIWPDYFNNVISKNEKFAQRSLSEWEADKKLLRRVLTVKLLSQLPMARMVAQYSDINVNNGSIVNFGSKDDYLNDAKWIDYIHLLDVYKPMQTIGNLVDTALNNTIMEKVPERGCTQDRKLWDTCKQGEILMAEKGGHDTISIVNGAITRTPNMNQFVGKIKATLQYF